MSFELMNEIGSMFLQVFGGPGVVAFVVIAFLIVLLLAGGVDNKAVIFMIILPVLVGVVTAVSNMASIPREYVWIVPFAFILFGIIFATIYWLWSS